MGTTAEKLTYLNATKGKIKDGINSLGGNIDSNTTFRDYATQLDSIYSRLPKVSGTGSDITLTPTLKGRLGIVPKGDTYQFSTTGKNLFNNNNVVSVNNSTLEITTTGFNVTRTHNSGYGDEFIASYTIENLSPNTTYTFNLDVETENNYDNGSIYVYSDQLFGTTLTKSNYVNSGNNHKWNITTSSNGKMVIGFYGTTATQNKIFKFTNIQLESGSSKTSYEPYTGGIASPNPDYPQDIQCVEGIQNISVYGKNLFNKNTITSGKEISNGQIYNNSSWCVSDYIIIEYNQKYIKNINNGNDCIIYDKDKNKISDNNRRFSNNMITITEQNAKYIRINLPLTSLDTYQLEQGSTPTTYEEYKGQTYEVNLGDIKLYSGDKITGTPDNWSVVHNSVESIIDGTLNITYESDVSTPTQRTVFRANITNNATTSQYLSNRFIQGSTTSNRLVMSGYRPYISLDNTITGINTSDTSTEKINKLKTWLSTHNVSIVFPLATPTTTPITDTNLIGQLNNVYKLKSYDDTTNISVEGNLPMIIEASALKDEI